MTLIKICGITESGHALAALEAGANMLGFVFAPASKRLIAPEVAREIIANCHERFPSDLQPWRSVGVFADQPLSLVTSTASICGLDVVQLSGAEPPDYGAQLTLPLFKTVHLPGLGISGGSAHGGESLEERLRSLKVCHRASRLLLDSGGPGQWGGTGLPFDWRFVGPAARDSMVAGGLNPTNVGSAIRVMWPWAVDVSSGVETDGRKNPDQIRHFVAAVRRADEYGEQ
jgi:phosphoribosylanthranilate isomerase